MSRHLGRRRWNRKEATVKTVVPWRKDLQNLKKHLAALMNKVMGRKAANLPEDGTKKLRQKIVMPNGNVWRTWRTSLTC